MISSMLFLLIVSIGKLCFGISLNQPLFHTCASWDTSAITLVKGDFIGQEPSGIFVSSKNNIYVSDRQNGQILMWSNESLALNKTIDANLIDPLSLFVTANDDIFVDRWVLNNTSKEKVIHVNSPCTGLFIARSDDLYCSSADEHRVYKVRLEPGIKAKPIVVAGTGCPGPVGNMLDHPYGIFVNHHFDLYVADSHNNRIQLFLSGQTKANTVAGFGAPVFFLLNKPTSVILDRHANLFIVDSGNHRILRSISDGFQCLFGCSGTSGASANQLNNPQTMAFDTYGNILLTDLNNQRVQKVILTQNLCSTYTFSVI